MNNTPEQLQQELEAARRTNAELWAELESRETANRLTAQELEAGRRKIEQAHQEWMAALDVVDAPIFLHDREFRILRCNRAYQQRARLSFKQIIGQPYYEVFPKTGAPLAGCLRVMEKAEAAADEEEIVIGGTNIRSRTYSVYGEQGDYLHSVHIFEDITEHKRAEAALRESSEKLRLFIHHAPSAIAMFDRDMRYVAFSRRWLTDYGLGEQELAGRSHYEVFPELSERLKEVHRRCMAGAVEKCDEDPFPRADGHVDWVRWESHPWRASGGSIGGIIIFSEVITGRKQAEEELRLRAQLLDNTADSIIVADLEGNFAYLNEAAWKTRGYTREELMAMGLRALDVPEYKKLIEARIRGLMEKGRSTFESAHRRKDGSVMPIEVGARIIESGGRKLILGVARDITERKQAEVALNHANRALATLSAVNRTLVRATGEDELLQAICGAIVEQKGYRMAWVGYKQDDESKSVKIMARAGHDAGYLDTAQITWAESERGMGPSGCAIRSGATQLCRDVAQDPRFLPWREQALERGYAASIALPLLGADKTVFGVLNVYAQEVDAFTESEVGLLEEMAGDLAFGVRALRIRHERDHALEQSRQHLVQLHDSLEDTVQAIASMVELRDPYTAGHQARVADLAMAIAKQMGLPEDRVHGIHLAGVVHDLGKIKVPAEILSKPGKITDIEYSLIKTHPQAGYDILKGINFPWPVAQMVLQHHERLDGSGYPQGLKGDAILIESRILSVADVVEAMSSHRPYRPGLGIEAALAEITGNRGKLYDPQAVDACQALFREQGYKL